jgi:hypothetical protein
MINPKFEFQLPSQDLQMHLHNLPKERLPKAPRTWKELSLQFKPLLSMLNKYFKMQSVLLV